MEPTQRKMKILEAVVETYIHSGEPVGSKALCDILDFSVSSATVRNDMAELANLGLLEQTHTSSGRVPTELGYRVYLDKLMKPHELGQREKTALSDALYFARLYSSCILPGDFYIFFCFSCYHKKHNIYQYHHHSPLKKARSNMNCC